MAGTTTLLAPEPQEDETNKQELQSQTTVFDYLTPEEIRERIRQIFLEDERTDPKCQQS